MSVGRVIIRPIGFSDNSNWGIDTKSKVVYIVNMSEKQSPLTRIDPDLVREIKLEVIALQNDPNISASDAIKFIFERYKALKATKTPRKPQTA